VRWFENTFYGKPVINTICVNPLLWKPSQDYAPAELNKGSVPFRFNRLDTGIADCKCSENGMLWVHKPQVSKKHYPKLKGSFYHMMDYNLFYVSVRENARKRTAQYFKIKNK
jgi:hypothetical protein